MKVYRFSTIALLVALLSSTELIGQERDSANPELANNGLKISEPLNGSVIESGDSVAVSAEPVPPFQAQSVALLSEFAVMEDSSPPFEFVLQIPADFVGRSNISALGKNGSGGFAEARPVEIIVEAPAQLTGISISPREIYLNGVNDRRQLRVSGQYLDGNERDLSGSIGEVSFVSSDPGVVSVSEAGMLVPKRNGTVTVSARRGSFEDRITVEVLHIDE